MVASTTQFMHNPLCNALWLKLHQHKLTIITLIITVTGHNCHHHQRHLARMMWKIASKIIIYCAFILLVQVVIKSCCYSRIRQVLLTSRNVGTLLRAFRKEEAPQKRLQTFGVQLKGNNKNTLKDSIGIEVLNPLAVLLISV